MTDMTKEQRRYPRFRVEAPLQLSVRNSKNISRIVRSFITDINPSGMHFLAGFDVQVGSEVDFETVLPAPIGGKHGCRMRGSARIIRCDRLRTSSEISGTIRTGYAATIEDFQMLPRSPVAPDVQKLR